ncbi:galactokinase [Fusibacillus kribbianus]|uniref:Galactokinase family protein n=1 Tax=Fusibacillus kribbianus TaxID=3044208 RepID=A0AAP4BDD9_9FIRM|nr:galactokinase family protein [Ruminococcus sp. YH-rum2234]MDI9242751.1 galactokinase family protein [Ruminococcus sp. YH-rum2234]
MKEGKVFLEELKKGAYDERLRAIYVDETLVPEQRARYERAVEKYEELFGPGEIEIYSAPGRSEVGGNHTDHQHGMVLATSVNLDAIAIVGLNEDNCIRIVSEGYDMITVELSDLSKKEEEEGTSAGLIRGVAAGLLEQGFPVKQGFHAYVTSNVLIGAGLSSSAAFEVIVGTVISGLFHEMKISPVEIAKVAQFAENVYFGKPCGLMDQMACSVGGLIHIDFADPKAPVVNRVSVDFDSYHYSLCIVDTKGSHSDLTEDYAQIPGEMKAVAAYFGKSVLREVDRQEFFANIAKIRQKTGDRAVLRAIHFYAENERALAEAEALSGGQFDEFLRLVKESGNSSFQFLQNVYTSRHVEEQGVSIGLAVSESILGDHGVCRVHGGGFAGTIQAFVKNDFVGEYRRVLDSVFGAGSCHVLKVRPYGGIRVL